MFTEPEVFFSKVVNTLMVVLFPAPFGPRKPKKSPFFTLNEMWSTALVPLEYTSTRSFTSIMFDIKMRITTIH